MASFLTVCLLVACLAFVGNSTPVAVDQRSACMSTEGKLFDAFTAYVDKNVQPASSLARKASPSCEICKLIVHKLQKLYSECSNHTLALKAFQYLCDKVGYDQVVCAGAYTEYEAEVFYIISKVLFNPRLCNYISDNCAGGKNKGWEITLPDVPKPEPKPYRDPPEGSPVYRVLHLADLHPDLHYVEGSEADCSTGKTGVPLCCRDIVEKPKSPAGKWGSLAKCDLPRQTLEHMLQHLSTQKFDFIYMTGDLPAHNIEKQSQEEQLNVINTVADLLLKYFPTTPVYAATGNHESYPANNFPPHWPDLPAKFSIQWLYDAFADKWPKLMQNSDPAIVAQIRKYANYVAQVKPKLRVISLNTLVSSRGNFWLFVNNTDPDGTLTWLASQLQEAENAGDKVHIIGHIPPGHKYVFPIWSKNYQKLIDRYESTVSGQFFGHTHQDAFEVFYNNASQYNRAVGVAYIAPSITTYSYQFPTYRVYTVDGERDSSTNMVLDHETYYYNLSRPDPEPVWELEYSAKAAYGLSSLSPQAWDGLIWRLMSDKNMLNKYVKHYWTVAERKGPCDTRCRKTLLCELRTGDSFDKEALCGDIRVPQ